MVRTAIKAARAACPEGKECGSVRRYIAPHSPGGLFRLTMNLISATIPASPSRDRSRISSVFLHCVGPKNHNSPIPPNHTHESPEWAKMTAVARRKPGLSSRLILLVNSASILDKRDLNLSASPQGFFQVGTDQIKLEWLINIHANFSEWAQNSLASDFQLSGNFFNRLLQGNSPGQEQE